MEWGRRRILMGAAGAACLAALPAPARAEPQRTIAIGGRAFGSYWRLTLASNADAASARSVAERIIAELDRTLSPFRPGSEMTKFNTARAGERVAVSAPCARVFHEGLRIAHLTGGAFDPTVGPIVARYGFGPIIGPPGGSYRALRAGKTHLRKSLPGLTFDPCGIAKGYALDRIADAISKLGHTSFVLDVGGELMARGRHPAGRHWRIAIERPVPHRPAAQRIVRLDGQAIATSGDWIQGYRLGRQRVSHIIDPRLGTPAAHGVASVSIIAPLAMTADALATGLMAMGPERGLALADKLALPVLFVLRDGDALREAASPYFAPFVAA